MAGTAGQRLQLLMELVPGLARIAVMHVSNNAAQLAILAQAQRDGQVLGLDIRPVGVTTVDDMDNVLKGLAADGVQAVLIAGIDAPEKKQAFGNRSKQNMVRLAHDRQARADCPKRNHYGRYVCKVWVGGDVGLTIPAQLRPL